MIYDYFYNLEMIFTGLQNLLKYIRVLCSEHGMSSTIHVLTKESAATVLSFYLLSEVRFRAYFESQRLTLPYVPEKPQSKKNSRFSRLIFRQRGSCDLSHPLQIQIT